jgi:hypothetical protein
MSLIKIISNLSKNKGGGVVTPPLTTYTKNLQRVENISMYEAFGFPIRSGADRITYFYRRGDDHLQGGKIYGRHFTISTGIWGAGFLIYEHPTLDCRDAWGGLMDNNQIVIFSCASEYSGAGTSLKSYAFMLIGDLDMNFGEPISLFNGSFPEMQRGLPFGGMQKGTEPGTYYIPMWQFNSDAGTTDEPTFPLYRTDLLKTTDYWATWTAYNIQTGTSSCSEVALGVFPDGERMTALIRRDPGGVFRTFESTNGGVNWTNRGNAVNISYAANKSRIPFCYINSSGLLDISYQDRDSGWISISRNNDPNTYFGTAVFNKPELYYFNRVGALTIGDNYKLGYTSLLEISPQKYFFAFARQETLSKANIWATLHDIDIDPDGIPVAPTLIKTAITSTSILVYVAVNSDSGALTQSQLANIRWFEVSVSQQSDFSTFETVRFQTAANPTTVAENYIFGITSQFNILGLTSATTYYVRVRAKNNAGYSGYTITSFTTL